VDESPARPVQELDINERGTGFDLTLELLLDEGPKEYLPSRSRSCSVTVPCAGAGDMSCPLGGHELKPSWDFHMQKYGFYILGPVLHKIVPRLFPPNGRLLLFCPETRESIFRFPSLLRHTPGSFSVAETKEITSWIPITNKLFLKCHNCSAAAARAAKYRTLIKHRRSNQFAVSLPCFLRGVLSSK